nr:Putative uncharacterized protein [Moritella viscosa]
MQAASITLCLLSLISNIEQISLFEMMELRSGDHVKKITEKNQLNDTGHKQI